MNKIKTEMYIFNKNNIPKLNPEIEAEMYRVAYEKTYKRLISLLNLIYGAQEAIDQSTSPTDSVEFYLGGRYVIDTILEEYEKISKEVANS